MNCFQCESEFNQLDRIPRILTQCGHSLCQICLQSSLIKGVIKCPECSIESYGQTYRQFPANLALQQLSQKVTDTCVSHNKALEAFCLTDKSLLCVSCILEDGHRSHQIQSIGKAASKFRETLQTYKQSLLSNQNLLQKEQEELQSISSQIAKQFDFLSKDYLKVYEGIRKAVDIREREILEKLQAQKEVELGVIFDKLRTNKQMIELIEDFFHDIKGIQIQTELSVIDSFKKREQLAKKASIKPQPLTKSELFTEFNKDIQAGYFWNLIKKHFVCIRPKTSTKAKQDDTVPLALANSTFTTNLRNKQPPKTAQRPSKPAKNTYYKPRVQPPQAKPTMSKRIQKAYTVQDQTLSIHSIDLASLYRAPQAFIYTIGGFSQFALQSVQCYSCEQNSWSFVQQSPTARTQFGCVFYHDQICLIGGKNSGKRTSSSDSYNRNQNTWSLGPLTLTKQRSGFLSVSISNDIYIAGGNDGNPVSTFQLWNGSQWINLPSMSVNRDQLGGAVGPDLKIYAVGGYSGKGMTCLNSAQRFNLETQRWEKLPNMKYGRRALQCVSLPDGIYAIGGYDGNKYLSAVQKFDIRINKWVQLQAMNVKRCTLSAVASPDCQFIYAIGGFSGSGTASVERYSVVENK